MRGQISLPALGIALLLLTATTAFVLFTADRSLDAERGESLEQSAATGLSDRLVARDASVTVRSNVLDAAAIRNLSVTTLREDYGLAEDAAVEITLDGKTIVADGSHERGTTIQRLVRVESTTERTLTPRLNRTRAVTLPRRSETATVTLSPPASTTVTTVRANDRVLLHDGSGLDGTYDVSLSRLATTTLSVEAAGPLPHGSVSITYEPITTRKATLSVTIARGRAE